MRLQAITLGFGDMSPPCESLIEFGFKIKIYPHSYLPFCFKEYFLKKHRFCVIGEYD